MVDRNHTVKLCVIYTVLVTLLLIGSLLIAFVPSLFQAVFLNQSPTLTVTAGSSADITEFTKEQLGEDCAFRVAYYNVSDVTVTINKKSYPLPDAIRDGLITIEEIIAQAQSDCRDQSICREEFSSELGCTTFIYQYNDFDIVYRYDVFERSDGQTYLFKDIVFAPFDQGRTINLNFGVEYPGDLLYEDWGLSFDVQEATPEYVKFSITQRNGQQVDKLVLDGYWLDDSDANILIEPLLFENPFELVNDDTTTVTIDWSEIYGELVPGDYKLLFMVTEQYESSDVHPLQKNYRETQTYSLEFTIS